MTTLIVPAVGTHEDELKLQKDLRTMQACVAARINNAIRLRQLQEEDALHATSRDYWHSGSFRGRIIDRIFPGTGNQGFDGCQREH